MGKIDIVILTPIEVEFQAVRKKLSNISDKQISGSFYCLGAFKGNYYNYSVAMRLTGSKNNEVALATEKAIQAFRPKLVILFGIAGGIKDVKLGDIVVGTKAYGYESGKVLDGIFGVRPESLPYSQDMIERLRIFARSEGWLAHASRQEQLPNVVFGPIASGEKVLASMESIDYQMLKQNYNDTIAIEMEAIGFAKAALPYSTIQTVNIRGISDLINNKTQTDQSGGQEWAVERVAKFVFGFLEQFDFSQLKILSMDIKEIASSVVSVIFPLLKLESVQQIGEEFKQGTDESIKELWEKVRPIFLEEIESEDSVEAAKIAAGSSLRKQLKEDEGLKKKLIKILQKFDSKNTHESGSTVNKGDGFISLKNNQISGGATIKLNTNVKKNGK